MVRLPGGQSWFRRARHREAEDIGRLVTIRPGFTKDRILMPEPDQLGEPRGAA
jgi:hypothetical protein